MGFKVTITELSNLPNLKSTGVAVTEYAGIGTKTTKVVVVDGTNIGFSQVTISTNEAKAAAAAAKVSEQNAAATLASSVKKVGDTMTGALSVDFNGTGLTLKRSQYPGLQLVSTGITNARTKLIEVNASGDLNIVTRTDTGANNGNITIRAGETGVVYHTGNRPTPNDLGAYTKSEVDQIVTDAGYGLKQIQLSAPAGVPATGYVPVIFTNVNHNEYCYISTKTSGGSDPMNNCVFDGIVRSGGWSDRGSYVTGQFNIYSSNERALHSIHGGTEADNFYVAYVEARAFPVTVKVPVGVFVATNLTVSYGTSVFVTDGQTGTGNTKGNILCTFDKGSGLYRNGNRVYDQGFKPTPSDVGTLSESTINTELDKKLDKAGGTVTGESLFLRPTKFGDTTWKAIVRSSVATNEYLFGGRADNTGDDVTDFVRVGVNKLEYGTSGNRYKIFHEGQVPSLSNDLNLQWTLPRPNGTSVYVRLCSIAKTDSDITLLISGLGDHGQRPRNTTFVTMSSRGNVVSVDINGTNLNTYGQKPIFYTKDTGSRFELWIKTPVYQLNCTMTKFSGQSDIIHNDSVSATDPTGLSEVEQKQFYTTGFKPSPADVGAVSKAGDTISGSLIIDGGLKSGTIRYYSTSSNLGITLSSNAAGYIEIVRNNNNVEEWTEGLRSYGAADWRIGANRIYTQGFKPTAADVNALPIAGGSMTGAIVVANSKGAIKVDNQKSISFQDQANTMFHLLADGNNLKIKHGNNGENSILDLSASQSIFNGIVQSNTQMLAYPTKGSWNERSRASFHSISADSVGASWLATIGKTSNDVRAGIQVLDSDTGEMRLYAGRSTGYVSVINGSLTASGSISGSVLSLSGGATVAGSINVTGGYMSLTNASNTLLEFHSPGVSAAMIYKTVDGSFRFVTSNGSGGEAAARMALDPSGNLHVIGTVIAASFVQTSDRRLKTDIKELSNCLEKNSKLVPSTYHKDGFDEDVREVGLMAQDVQEVLPEAVIESAEGVLGVNYAGVTTLNTGAINELYKLVQELQEEIRILKSK
ncbi:tail fiber domain-containing protein [Aeromonas hydrophila]|uniref:tail fiber domain-containing protein n=1 Tax=Aeromonas hydrophila TaxID=644 RepID=UPI002B4967BD|nr:tail fiber domain-containing protein [Aeromonas hydrophila]